MAWATGEAAIDIETAQAELRAVHVAGASGVIASGFAWLTGGAIWARFGADAGFTVLLIGGVLIFPISLFISRMLFGAPVASKTNPFNRLGFETTVPLFAGLLIAWLLMPNLPALAFAAFAMIVGARYFAFATLYGDRVFWALGGAIFAVGYAYAGHADRLPLNVVICTGLVELGFATVLLARRRRAA